jgi:predicted ATPase
MTAMAGVGFISRVRIDSPEDATGYPYDLPAVAAVVGSDGFILDRAVTFLVGENGSGKSTLVEAIAVAAGFNAEGGSRNFNFATRATESSLADHVMLVKRAKPRTGYFLRAESYYNVATEIEELNEDEGKPGLIADAHGGVSPHERSHGESFLDLVTHRFGRDGLYLLDEPEAALSVRGCLALMARIAELSNQNCQFLIATHSPILLALPGAAILEITEGGRLERVGFDDALPVQMTRDFLTAPDRYLRHLL